jgi:hypothetical protein
MCVIVVCFEVFFPLFGGGGLETNRSPHHSTPAASHQRSLHDFCLFLLFCFVFPQRKEKKKGKKQKKVVSE